MYFVQLKNSIILSISAYFIQEIHFVKKIIKKVRLQLTKIREANKEPSADFLYRSIVKNVWWLTCWLVTCLVRCSVGLYIGFWYSDSG